MFQKKLCSKYSGSGKSYLFRKLVQNANHMFSPPPSEFIIFYRQHQSLYDDLQNNSTISVTCYEGLQFEHLENIESTRYPMVILDDLQNAVTTRPEVCELVYSGRHRNLAGVILVLHNIFAQASFYRFLLFIQKTLIVFCSVLQGPQMRTISLNIHTYVLMRCPRVKSSLSHLGSQLGMKKLLEHAYSKATQKPYSHLVVDFSNRIDTSGHSRALRSNIFAENGPTIVYMQTE